jgi:hypothetical protein
MCLLKTAARQPLVEIAKEFLDGQGDDHTRGQESLRTAVHDKPSINYPSRKADAQRPPVSVVESLAFNELKSNRLLWRRYYQVDPLHPPCFPLEEAG